MSLDDLQTARNNMAKNAHTKRDVLQRLDRILAQGNRASKQDLAWAKRQAVGFARPH